MDTLIEFLNQKKTALHIAFEEKNIKIIELLLSRPEIDVNIINFSNMYEKYDHEIKTTVLNMAVEYGSVQMGQTFVR